MNGKWGVNHLPCLLMQNMKLCLGDASNTIIVFCCFSEKGQERKRSRQQRKQSGRENGKRTLRWALQLWVSQSFTIMLDYFIDVMLYNCNHLTMLVFAMTLNGFVP